MGASEGCMIYLDYQATTPLAPEAFAAMEPWLKDGFANPHSAHAPGRAAAAAVEVAREQVAALLPEGGRVIFTSGATEAINLAVSGVEHGDFLTIATEHAAVLDSIKANQRFELHVAPVGSDGQVDMDYVFQNAGPGLGLVAAMLVNNEIGVINPIDEISSLADFAGAPLLVDAVQAYGRICIPEGPDFIAISAHKIYGPKGIGALWVRDGIKLEPLMHGGGQEQGLRSGTLSPALCAGFGAAAKLAGDRTDVDSAHVTALWDRAVAAFSDWTINGSTTHRYKGNLNIRRDGVDVARLMSECRDIAFSAGSACASGSGRLSHVLRAIGLTDAQAKSSIRLGFGRYTTAEEIDIAAATINAAAEAML
jgi:cysteine desulfurase